MSTWYHWPLAWSAPVFHCVELFLSMPPARDAPAPTEDAVAVQPDLLTVTGLNVLEPPEYFFTVAAMRSFAVKFAVPKRCSF